MSEYVIEPVSYDYAGASAATGYSVDVIRRAVRAGDLVPRYAVVAGRQLTKPVIPRDELRAWIAAGATERPQR